MKRSRGKQRRSFRDKYLALCIPLLICTGASAQTPIIYTPMTAAGYKFKYVTGDSGLTMPFLDTSLHRGITRPGSIVTNPSDTIPYYFTGKKWKRISTDSIPTDSLAFTKIGDSTCLTVNGIQRCAVDSAGSTGNTIYTGDGYIPKDRNIYISEHSTFQISDSSGENGIQIWTNGLQTTLFAGDTSGNASILSLATTPPSFTLDANDNSGHNAGINGDANSQTLDFVAPNGHTFTGGIFLVSLMAGMGTDSVVTYNTSTKQLGYKSASSLAGTLQNAFDAAPTASPQINAHGNYFTIDSASYSFYTNGSRSSRTEIFPNSYNTELINDSVSESYSATLSPYPSLGLESNNSNSGASTTVNLTPDSMSIAASKTVGGITYSQLMEFYDSVIVFKGNSGINGNSPRINFLNLDTLLSPPPFIAAFDRDTLKKVSSDLRKYKVYTATLTQSGTSDPVAVVVENSIGAIVWARTATGTFTATLSSAFVAAKTWVTIAEGFFIAPVSTSVISLTTNAPGTATPTDGEMLLPVSVEIRVYN